MTPIKEAFETYWTESPQNLSRAALGSPECEMHRRTWNDATERAAKLAEDAAEGEWLFGSKQSEAVCEQIAAAIRAAGGAKA